MKSLLALLVVGLLLGIGYWKTQYPDATVEDLTASAGGSFNNLKSSVANLSGAGAQTEAMNTRIDSLEAELVETQNAAIDGSVVTGRLTDTERQVTAIDSKLDLLNRRIDEQSQQFNADSINNALSDLDSKINALTENQQRNGGDQSVAMASMNEKLDAFEARLNTLSSDASAGQAEAVASVNAQIDQRIALLENKLGTTNSDSLRIESMSNELSASRVKMNAIEKSVDETNQQLAALNQTVNALKTRSESSSIDDQQSELRLQLTQLQDKLTQVDSNSNVSELNSALQATRDRIQSLEQQVVNLPASSSEATDATEAQSALQAQIKALENKLSSMNTEPDPKLINTLSAVEEKVTKLESKAYVTQEDLRAQQQAKSTEYKIYFEKNSTEISTDAGKVLNSFIAQEKNRTTGVSIYGFTDRRGSAAYNQQLALQRATNVRSYLIQNGFSYTKIKSLSGLGEDAAAAQFEDGQEDAQQRTVVLYALQP